MGGDYGLRATIPASLKCLQKYSDVDLVLVGSKSEIEYQLSVLSGQRLPDIEHAPDVIAMDEKPSRALRSKKRSSMRVALELLRDGKADAVVSAGNTGALMALAYFLLPRLPGIDRPAICTSIPTKSGQSYVLDLGANAQCSAEQLYQFALQGAALAATSSPDRAPSIALLNIGEELVKGSEIVKAADQLLRADKDLNYIGFVEGDDILSGCADVIVCDGFVGNVALKVIEGTAVHISGLIREKFSANRFTQILGWLVRPILQKVYAELNPQQYNGANMLGFEGILIKSHGNSTAEGFYSAIEQAIVEVKENTVQITKEKLQRLA